MCLGRCPGENHSLNGYFLDQVGGDTPDEAYALSGQADGVNGRKEMWLKSTLRKSGGKMGDQGILKFLHHFNIK